ncbi:MFS transporter [Lentzea sp. HUAS TT2]|uniref:MFS transporter n=1 Tax=Lentzea sp. HUAS TT2 TaxID=3447454 RepID=UPI003F6FAC27
MTTGNRRDFRLYLGAQAISSVGSGCTAFVFPVLALQLTGSPLALGMTTVLSYLPYLVFGLPIGALVDRFDLRRILVWTDAGRAVVVGLVPALYFLGALHIGLLLAVVAVHATMRIAFEAAQFAVIPSLVDREDLHRANGRVQAAYNAGAVFGPSIAGAVTLVADVSTVLVVDAVSFLVSAAAIAAIRTPLTGERSSKPMWRAVGEGLAVVWRSPVLRTITLVAVGINLFTGPYWAQLVFLAKDRWGAGDAQVGQVFAAASIGVVIAGLSAGRLVTRFGFLTLVTVAVVGMGLAVSTAALTGSLIVGAVCAAGVRAFAVLFATSANTVRQRLVPVDLLGRVITVSMVFAWSAQPLGAAIGSVAVEVTNDVSGVILVSGLLVVALGLVVPWTVLRDVEAVEPVPVRGDDERG